jgi:hypothetical protein
MPKFLVIALLAAAAIPAAAQARGAIRMGGMGRSGNTRVLSPGFRIGFHANPRFSGRFHRGGFLNSPFFYPAFDDYPQDDYSPENQGEAAPPFAVVPVPQGAPARAEAPHSAPLLIEWQGDRFVRYGGTASDQMFGAQGRSAFSEQEFNLRPQPSRSRKADSSATSMPAQEPTATMLVFRDGRHEETANYSIIGDTLYEYADYWTNGSWAKKVQISDLDLAATVRTNDERGVKFVLPAGPNQIVTSF